MTVIYHLSQLNSHTIQICRSNISREQLKTSQEWKNLINETSSKKSVAAPDTPGKYPLLFASIHSIPIRQL